MLSSGTISIDKKQFESLWYHVGASFVGGGTSSFFLYSLLPLSIQHKVFHSSNNNAQPSYTYCIYLDTKQSRAALNTGRDTTYSFLPVTLLFHPYISKLGTWS